MVTQGIEIFRGKFRRSLGLHPHHIEHIRHMPLDLLAHALLPIYLGQAVGQRIAGRRGAQSQNIKQIAHSRLDAGAIIPPLLFGLSLAELFDKQRIVHTGHE